MIKGLKKLTVLVLALVVGLATSINVKAFDSTITLKGDGVIRQSFLYDLATQYISLKGEMKNDTAVVNQQYVQITKDQFNKIREANIAKTDYIKSDEYNKSVALFKTWKEKQEIKYQAEHAGTVTQQQIDEEAQAKAAYDAAINERNAKLEQLTKAEGALVPSFDNAKWNKIEKTESTATENRYAINVTNDYEYFVSWVKVTINGVDYYNYDVKCLKLLPPLACKIVNGKYYNKAGKEVTQAEYNKECNPSCKIENNKYYDKDGNEVTKENYDKLCGNPKTGTNIYYIYGVGTILIALSLYMFTRKVKKFEN